MNILEKLRVRVISPGYSPIANVQFPRAIRAEGREYLVPRENIKLAETRGKFFYTCRKGITIVDPASSSASSSSSSSSSSSAADAEKLKMMKVYGDENLEECPICMEDSQSNKDLVFIILGFCGHVICETCSTRCKTCPMCRATVERIVRKEELQQ